MISEYILGTPTTHFMGILSNKEKQYPTNDKNMGYEGVVIDTQKRH